MGGRRRLQAAPRHLIKVGYESVRWKFSPARDNVAAVRYVVNPAALLGNPPGGRPAILRPHY